MTLYIVDFLKAKLSKLVSLLIRKLFYVKADFLVAILANFLYNGCVIPTYFVSNF